MSEILQVSREGRVERLRLNRPEKRNALNLELCRRLIEALREASQDDGVGAILIEGAGGYFCSGMDLNEAPGADVEAMIATHAELFSSGMRLQKPMVAAVEGGALAGGLGLALNAHFVVAAPGARFGVTETRIGFWPFVIFPVLVRAIGERRAVQLTLEARLLDTDEARGLGLIDREGSSADASELAARLSEASADAVGSGLEFVCAINGLDEAALRKATARFRELAQQSPDFVEGVQAFREKRRPQWPSHAIGQQNPGL